jgi:tricorn protease
VKLRVNGEREGGGRARGDGDPDRQRTTALLPQLGAGQHRAVEKATGGKVGYVHVPDMAVPGLNEFAKFYYPQLHKEALIVDCRGNGGGNVSPA